MPAPAVKMSAAVAEPDVAEAASTAKGSSFVASNATTSGTSSRLSSAEAKVGEKATTDSKPSAAQGSEDEHKDGEHKTEVIGVKSGSLAASAAPIEQESGTLETKSIETSSEEVAAKVPAKKSAAKTSKSLSRMITLFFLLVACGAFYGAWTYEPGFQSLVKEQVNHLLVLTGMAPKTQAPAPVPVKPTSQAPKPSAAVPLPTNGPDATQSGQSIAPIQMQRRVRRPRRRRRPMRPRPLPASRPLRRTRLLRPRRQIRPRPPRLRRLQPAQAPIRNPPYRIPSPASRASIFRRTRWNIQRHLPAGRVRRQLRKRRLSTN